MNKKKFLIHISTDEVFGHVIKNKSFNEKTKIQSKSTLFSFESFS